jgi:hypothetical protein
MSAEGVMYDWCVLNRKQELQLGQDVAAMGCAAFTAATALARFGGDALRARYTERNLLRASTQPVEPAAERRQANHHPADVAAGFRRVEWHARCCSCTFAVPSATQGLAMTPEFPSD